MPTVLKFWSLNLLEPSVPVQACIGIALPLYRILKITPFGALGGITFISSFGENRSTRDKQTKRLKGEGERNRKDKKINGRKKEAITQTEGC
jgi:hypothetical protein